jgi:microcystin degradation protein MlrC
MAERQLSVRSAKASEIAHRLARTHNRTVAKTVERALELLDAQEGRREPAEEFYDRISRDYGVDVDILDYTKELHEPHRGIDL